MRKNKIWSFVGAGGKTTGIFLLAEHFLKKGLRVLVTTTTHMALPENPAFVPGDSGAEIVKKLEQDRFVIAGIPVSERKIAGISTEALREGIEAADVVLIESDGSARLPFKVPASYEPVIIPQTERIIVMAGLTALGKPVAEICHRKEIFWSMTGASPDSLLTVEGMAAGIYGGYLLKLSREYPRASITVVLNQADDEKLRMSGDRVKRELLRWCEYRGFNQENLNILILSWRKMKENEEEPEWLSI